jgi:protein-S-isoprenylcysteine O-methyltransferase Ste14
VKPLLHTLAFTVLVPGTVAGYVPWRLRNGSPIAASPWIVWPGALLIALGVAIYLHTAFWGFALHGRGTPAPIAPTKKLVVKGLHRYVRNPMYLGVLGVVLGQAVLFQSRSIALYAVFFWLAAHLFVLFYEEPTLNQQFGSDYDDYRRRVPRWLPKF